MSDLTKVFKNKKRVARQIKSETKITDTGGTSRGTTEQDKDIDFLKDFDLNLEFGPCCGITRLERWARAEKHELNPPLAVKELVEQHSDDELYTKCLWKDYSI